MTLSIAKQDVWLWAKLERVGADLFVAKFTAFEADRRGKTPRSFDVLGYVLKHLHLAMGGDPKRSGGLVGAENHTHLAIPGGTIQSLEVMPLTEDKARADAVWEQAFIAIEAEWSSMFGALGRVRIVDGEHGPMVEAEYGPGVVIEAMADAPTIVLAKPEDVPPPPPGGRIVEMEAVCRPSSGLRAS